MSSSFWVRSSLVLVVLFGISVAIAMVGIPPFEVVDVGPDDSVFDPGDRNATSGGRVNGIAIDPGNDDILYAASEWGGLFKTIDGADSWIMLEAHRPQVMWDVAVDPGNTGTVYATSFYDGRTTPESGIQVSYDGGATWTKPATSTPTAALQNCGASFRAEPSAFGIGIRPDQPSDVFIGTNCGLAISNDTGVTWTHVNPTSQAPVPGNNMVWDVFVQAGGIVDVCGADGHHRSTDNGVTWSGASTLPGGTCSISASPLEPNTLLVTVAGGLWESRNGGTTWTQIDDNGGGRIPSVGAVATGANSFDLYWGAGVKLRRVGCDDSSTPRCGSDATNDGPGLGNDITGSAHDDTGTVAFDSTGCARYYSNDGGLFRNTGCPGISWQRAMSGLHGMWAFDLDAAPLSGGGGTAINFGLQDDGIWHSPDGGASWDSLNCCDGFDNEVDGERAVFTICCSGGDANGTRIEIGDADNPNNNRSVINHPAGQVPNFQFQDGIAQFGPESYAMVTLSCTAGANGCNGNGQGGAWVTFDEGANWARLGAAQTPTNACGILASVSLGTPVFYVMSGDCGSNQGNTGRLWRYSGTASNGTWTAADNGLTDVSVFAVHPTQPQRLLAADEAGPTRMVSSEDGGLTWTPLPALDAMMNGGGAFLMDTQRGPTNFTGRNGYSQPSLVHFHPENDEVLLAGARDAGLFISSDRGASWGLVSDRVSRPWHAAFDPDNDAIYVGTQGRGVYEVALPEVDLGITKTDTPDPVIAGGQLFYTITVENFGPDEATDVVVTDLIPPEVDFIVDDLSNCSEASPGQVVCEVGDLGVGETATVVIKVKVREDIVVLAGQPTSIQNTAFVGAPGLFDANEDNDSTTIGTIVEDQANLAVTKLCEPDREIPAGQIAVCTIIIDNYGPSDARSVVALDALASEGDFSIVGTPVPSQGGPCFVWNNTWTCNLGTLPAATSTVEGRATIEVEVTSDEGVDIADLTKVVSDTPDPDIGNNESTDVILVTAVADLSLSKSDNVDPVVAGESLTYTVGVSNAGPSAAENVVISDFVPAGVSLVSVSGSGGGTCNAGVPGDPFLPTTCSFGTLAAGSARTMTIVVDVHPETRGALLNDARVSSATLDDDTSNDLANETTSVVASADLQVAKTDLQDPVVAGEILDYELTVVNAGPSSSRNVVITDLLPEELTFLSATILDGSGECVLADPTTNTVTCHIGELLPNPGTPVFIEVKGHVSASTPSGTLTNIAMIGSTETPDPVAANDSTQEDTAVITVADLAIDKTSNQDTYKPSPQVIYTITVTNLGSSDAQDVVVVDTLPTVNHDYLFDTQACTGGETGVATCSVGTIAAGTSASFNIHIKVKGNAGQISNTADVSSSTTDPDLANNTDTLENLIAGGTGESGGGGPGPNALSPADYTLVEAEATCSRTNPKAMDIKLAWLDEHPRTRRHAKRVEFSPQRSELGKRGNARSAEVRGGVNADVVTLRLEPGTIYHWQIGKGRGQSGTASFETPFCPVYDEDE